MKYKVAVTDTPVDDLSVEREMLSGMHVEKVTWNDEASLVEALQDADAVLCMHTPVTEWMIERLPNCKVIATYGSGVDNIDMDAARRHGKLASGTVDYCTEEVANHTLALLLAWNRKIIDYDRAISENLWNQRHLTVGTWICGPIKRLSKQSLGLVGFGYIARAVAARARACGIRVTAYSRHPDQEAARDLGVDLLSLDNVLAGSDFLSLHLPLSESTYHFINRETLGKMKPGSVLINTSRGRLVDETALVEFLRAGRLGGALLDVYERQPLPVESPLHELPNVILTPHVAFFSEDSMEALRRRTVEIILNALK